MTESEGYEPPWIAGALTNRWTIQRAIHKWAQKKTG